MILDDKYNREGPNSCMDDKTFKRIWEYFERHDVPNRGEFAERIREMLEGHFIGNRLRPMVLLEDSASIKENEDSIKDYKKLLFEAKKGSVFFITSGWRARRFDDGYYPFCLEDVKWCLKHLAEEVGIL